MSVSSDVRPISPSASMLYVSGRASLIVCNQSAISARATNSPPSRIWGMTTAGMNCTAWNSLVAKAPQALPGVQRSSNQ